MNTRILGLAAGLAVLFASTSWAQSITVAIGSEPSTLDPQLRDDGGERQVNDNIYEALMARTATGDLVPGLAADAPTQVDARTWQFKLREGIKFHNGEPFNADAVVASVLRVIDPANNSEQMAYLGPLSGAEKVDDLTVRIITSAPDPILPARMYWLKMVPAAYSKNATAIAEKPVGTGPYKFGTWDRGNSITMTANTDYWGGEPQIDDVTYRFVSEAGTRLSGLVAGEFDVVVNLLPEFADSVPQAKSVSGLETSVIILGVDNPAVKDVRVRRALNMAIDRHALAESLFAGNAKVTTGQLVLPGAFGYNESSGKLALRSTGCEEADRGSGRGRNDDRSRRRGGALAEGPGADRGGCRVLDRGRTEGECRDPRILGVSRPHLRHGQPARQLLCPQLERAF